MKRISAAAVSLILLFLFGCSKQSTTNLNVYSDQKPAFTVSGIMDLKLTTGLPGLNIGQLILSVDYQDSVQQKVALTVSGLPSGITYDTSLLVSGYPPFATYLYLYDTAGAGVAPGNYPVTLTFTGSVTGSKVFTFNISVLPEPSFSGVLLGKFWNCSSNGSTAYTDSVYNDPTIVNKVWFTNFLGLGLNVYAYVDQYLQLRFPTQKSGAALIATPVAGSGNAFLMSTTSQYEINIGSVTVQTGTGPNANYFGTMLR